MLLSGLREGFTAVPGETSDNGFEPAGGGRARARDPA